MNEIGPSWVQDVLGMSCLVTDAAFELKVVKCATESNDIYPYLQKSGNSIYAC